MFDIQINPLIGKIRSLSFHSDSNSTILHLKSNYLIKQKKNPYFALYLTQFFSFIVLHSFLDKLCFFGYALVLIF